MTDTSPDIEIYLKRVDQDALLTWLAQHFSVESQHAAGDTLKLQLIYQEQPLECTIVNNAARGGYSSLWFKQNITPWSDDEACARAAFETLGVEVRCSKGGWLPGQEDEGAWLRFTDKGVSEVNWRT